MWSDILDQPLAVRILQRHLARARVAPVYLFTGPPGVGKRRCALELAKALNCAAEGERPCDACDSCRRIDRGTHPDVHELVPDGPKGLIAIDAVRQLLGRVGLRPYVANEALVILDGADRLTEEAANSCLKFLEEPTERTRLVLLTSFPWQCLSTIISRCHRVRFQPLGAETVAMLLQREASCDPVVARAISRIAQGGLATAMALARNWEAHQARMAQSAVDDPRTWVGYAMPQDRRELEAWLLHSIRWLRDVAVASVGATALIAHDAARPIIERHAQRRDPREFADATLRVMALRDSLEQSVSARLVGTLLREEWINVTGTAR